MAKSPFPGMDPFLESYWLDVHTRLTNSICDQLQEQLPEDLLARMEARVLVEDVEVMLRQVRNPDVYVSESPRHGGGGTAVLQRPEATTIEPDLVLVETAEPITQRFLQIVDAQTRTRVVTTIELVSPSNKRRGDGQHQYLVKRDECLGGGVNVVEIDLTRGGDRYSILPQLHEVEPRPSYVGCVRRAENPGSMGLYLFSFDKPLKPMRIPLRRSDEDAVLSLQPLVAQAYDRGRYDRLDYRRELEPPPSKEEAAVMERFLKEAGKI